MQQDGPLQKINTEVVMLYFSFQKMKYIGKDNTLKG